MDKHGADLTRLSLLIQRILDADGLCDREGTLLLTETEAAHRSFDDGNPEAAQRHIEQVVFFTKYLVQAGILAAVDGNAVLMTANDILSWGAADSSGQTPGNLDKDAD